MDIAQHFSSEASIVVQWHKYKNRTGTGEISREAPVNITCFFSGKSSLSASTDVIERVTDDTLIIFADSSIELSDRDAFTHKGVTREVNEIESYYNEFGIVEVYEVSLK